MLGAVVFIIVGLLLVFLEFFLPGAIMGISGGILVAVGLVLFAMNSTSLWLIILVFAVTIAALIFLASFALKRLKKSKIYLDDDQAGYKASGWSEEMVGREGKVVSNLKPAGHISIEGKRFQAVSKMGYIDRGSEIVVIGGQGAHLIERKKDGM